jgi:hypothetical protein
MGSLGCGGIALGGGGELAFGPQKLSVLSAEVLGGGPTRFGNEGMTVPCAL